MAIKITEELLAVEIPKCSAVILQQSPNIVPSIEVYSDKGFETIPLPERFEYAFVCKSSDAYYRHNGINDADWDICQQRLAQGTEYALLRIIK